jgi:hypothetical protein
MSERNWDKELAKIDKHLAATSDDQLLERKAAPARGAASTATTVPSVTGAAPTPWGVAIRVGLTVALAAAVPFWPYASRCGVWFLGYLGTIAVLLAAGVWAAVSTWRARVAKLHIAALVVITWGAALAAREILPRAGYTADASRAGWLCK